MVQREVMISPLPLIKTNDMKKALKTIKYVSVLLVGLGPYVIDEWYGPTFIINGIALMSIEFVRTKQYHLLALNIVSIFGYVMTMIERYM